MRLRVQAGSIEAAADAALGVANASLEQGPEDASCATAAGFAKGVRLKLAVGPHPLGAVSSQAHFPPSVPGNC